MHELLERGAPDAVAVEQPDVGAFTYAELRARIARLAGVLVDGGLLPGDRVALPLPKSLGSHTALLAVLSAGGVCVPADARAPLDRTASILDDSEARLLLVEADRAARLTDASTGHWREVAALESGLLLLARDGPCAAAPPGLAYILFTSGSTGRPKGVMISHANARAFVDWCVATFDTSAADRFGSHAPFHFDLSVLDVYLCLAAGARLVLIDESTGRQPRRLAPLIAERRLSVWYSTPSVLSLLVEDGRLDRHDSSALRWVLFAGEVFPVRHLRALTEAWPGARFVNLYGPTETNVVTFHEVALPVPPERTEPYPIGQACAHVRAALLDARGTALPDESAGESEGELCIAGPSVTAGYWNRPERTAAAFHQDPDGTRWYRTGDVVTRGPQGFVFLGRRDRMVKRRGHRVELGEVEARLYRHPDLAEVAVVAADDAERGVVLTAFVAWHAGRRPSLVALKRFCTDELPSSMVPDAFVHRDRLPRTSTDKVDYERLRSLA